MTIETPMIIVRDQASLDTAAGGLLNKLDGIAQLATASKWRRLVYAPFRYLPGIFFRGFIYWLTKKGIVVTARLFWGDRIKVWLPSSMDLFLLGCKTDDSEIRLARFIINNLRQGDHFLDIGSHAGYYSLLSSACMGDQGKVLSIEASPKSFSILWENVSVKKNIKALNIAISDKKELVSFFEFPVIHSEYNTMDVQQFKDQPWFRDAQITKVEIESTTGDSLLEKYHFHPRMIKIDVEGAEHKVVKGLKNFLLKSDPLVAMEFMNSKRGNQNHIQADRELKDLEYTAYIILPGGELEEIQGEVKDHVDRTGLDSDNIIYKKQNFLS